MHLIVIFILGFVLGAVSHEADIKRNLLNHNTGHFWIHSDVLVDNPRDTKK